MDAAAGLLEKGVATKTPGIEPRTRILALRPTTGGKLLGITEGYPVLTAPRQSRAAREARGQPPLPLKPQAKPRRRAVRATPSCQAAMQGTRTAFVQNIPAVEPANAAQERAAPAAPTPQPAARVQRGTSSRET